MKVRTSLLAGGSEKNLYMFFAKTLLHIFQRTGFPSDQEMAPGHMERLVSQVLEGMTYVEGRVPRLDKARVLAEDVLQELQEKFGDKLSYVLLEQSPCVEAMVVLCLQKHAEKSFQENRSSVEAANCDWQLCLASFCTGVIVGMCGQTLNYYSQYFY